MFVRAGGGATAARRAVEETELHKIRFLIFFNCFTLFHHCGGERSRADRPAVKFFNYRVQNPPVYRFQAKMVYFYMFYRLFSELRRIHSLALHFSVILR